MSVRKLYTLSVLLTPDFGDLVSNFNRLPHSPHPSLLESSPSPHAGCAPSFLLGGVGQLLALGIAHWVVLFPKVPLSRPQDRHPLGAA